MYSGYQKLSFSLCFDIFRHDRCFGRHEYTLNQNAPYGGAFLSCCMDVDNFLIACAVNIIVQLNNLLYHHVCELGSYVVQMVDIGASWVCQYFFFFTLRFSLATLNHRNFEHGS